MTRTNIPAEDAAAQKSRYQRPEDAKQASREAHADAATRIDKSDARLGAELSSENRPSDDTETADALKRAAENERRS
jgi:hypothetical protein